MKKKVKEFIDNDVVNLPSQNWTDEEVEVLRYCKSKGYPPKRIYENRVMLGLDNRSYGSIDSRYHKIREVG